MSAANILEGKGGADCCRAMAVRYVLFGSAGRHQHRPSDGLLGRPKAISWGSAPAIMGLRSERPERRRALDPGYFEVGETATLATENFVQTRHKTLSGTRTVRGHLQRGGVGGIHGPGDTDLNTFLHSSDFVLFRSREGTAPDEIFTRPIYSPRGTTARTRKAVLTGEPSTHRSYKPAKKSVLRGG